MGNLFSTPCAMMAPPRSDSFRNAAADFIQQPPSAGDIGKKEPLVCNTILENQVELCRNFSSIRLTGTETQCRDRDCFYRSVMFSYLEHILETQSKLEVWQILRRLKTYKKKISSLGGNANAFDHLFRDFKNLLESYSRGKRGFARKKELMRQCSSRSLTLLVLRLLIAAQIYARRDDLPPDFHSVYRNLEEFWSGRVLPIGSTHLHADLLSKALGVPIRVVDFGNINDTIPKPTICCSNRQFEIILLYRPDEHYDILYPSLSEKEVLYAVVDREYTYCCGFSARLFKAMYTFD